MRYIHKLRSIIGGGSSEIVVGPNLTIEGAKRPRIEGEARGRKPERNRGRGLGRGLF